MDSARQFAAKSLRQFPKLKVATRRLDRKVTGGVARLRQELAQPYAPLRGVTRALSANHVADVRIAAVLDGRTLNIDMLAPQFTADEVVSAELYAVRGSSRLMFPARIRPELDGTCRIEVTAMLDDSPGGHTLRPGAPWFLEATVETKTHGQQNLKLLGRRQNAGTLGLTVASPPHPDNGYRYQTKLYWSGRLAVTVSKPAPIAELSRVDLDWLHARLDVRAVGWKLDEDAVLEVTNRAGLAQVTVPGQRVGPDRIRCELPTAELAALSAGSDRKVFRLYLRSGGRRLAVGRTLHDLLNAKRILKPTPAIVWAGPKRSVRIQVDFTPSSTALLACQTLDRHE